jgi:hypothetical protein
MNKASWPAGQRDVRFTPRKHRPLERHVPLSAKSGHRTKASEADIRTCRPISEIIQKCPNYFGAFGCQLRRFTPQDDVD